MHDALDARNEDCIAVTDDPGVRDDARRPGACGSPSENARNRSTSRRVSLTNSASTTGAVDREIERVWTLPPTDVRREHGLRGVSHHLTQSPVLGRRGHHFAVVSVSNTVSVLYTWCRTASDRPARSSSSGGVTVRKRPNSNRLVVDKSVVRFGDESDARTPLLTLYRSQSVAQLTGTNVSHTPSTNLVRDTTMSPSRRNRTPRTAVHVTVPDGVQKATIDDG